MEMSIQIGGLPFKHQAGKEKEGSWRKKKDFNDDVKLYNEGTESQRDGQKMKSLSELKITLRLRNFSVEYSWPNVLVVNHLGRKCQNWSFSDVGPEIEWPNCIVGEVMEDEEAQSFKVKVWTAIHVDHGGYICMGVEIQGSCRDVSWRYG